MTATANLDLTVEQQLNIMWNWKRISQQKDFNTNMLVELISTATQLDKWKIQAFLSSKQFNELLDKMQRGLLNFSCIKQLILQQTKQIRFKGRQVILIYGFCLIRYHLCELTKTGTKLLLQQQSENQDSSVTIQSKQSGKTFTFSQDELLDKITEMNEKQAKIIDEFSAHNFTQQDFEQLYQKVIDECFAELPDFIFAFLEQAFAVLCGRVYGDVKTQQETTHLLKIIMNEIGLNTFEFRSLMYYVYCYISYCTKIILSEKYARTK